MESVLGISGRQESTEAGVWRQGEKKWGSNGFRPALLPEFEIVLLTQQQAEKTISH